MEVAAFNLFFSSFSDLFPPLMSLNSRFFQPLHLLFASQFVLFFLLPLSALLLALFTSFSTLFCLSANSFGFCSRPHPFPFSIRISPHSFIYCHLSCVFYWVSSIPSSVHSFHTISFCPFSTLFPFYYQRCSHLHCPLQFLFMQLSVSLLLLL